MQYFAPGAQNYGGIPTSQGWASPSHAQAPIPPRRRSSHHENHQQQQSPQPQRIAWSPTKQPTPGQPLLRNGKVLIYPTNLWCTKCGNTGFKAFDPSHPCRKCWSNYAQPYQPALKNAIDRYNPPPENWQRPLQAFASPTQSFTNPAGERMRVWQSTHSDSVPQNALVVQPGDPRIGPLTLPAY